MYKDLNTIVNSFVIVVTICKISNSWSLKILEVIYGQSHSLQILYVCRNFRLFMKIFLLKKVGRVTKMFL